MISEKTNIKKIKDMDYDSFYEWINYRIKNDWKYHTTSSFYGILLIFEKNLTKIQNLELSIDVISHLKPIYPW
jgi:hypothetical protein